MFFKTICSLRSGEYVFFNLQYPILFGTGVPDKEMGDKKFQEIMGWVTDFIKPTGYVAGTNHLTVADIAFLSTYS